MNTTSTTDGQPTVTWVLEAKFKELTDEEIISIYQDLWKFLPSEEPDLAKDIKKFARAILRKAQER